MKIKSAVKKIHVTRRESGFDRACEEAYSRALSLFAIDEDGHAKDKRFDRSTSSLVVKFRDYRVNGSMGGISNTYVFDAWMENYGDEDDA